ncbi:helix-turn-helix domain-containing protein [Shewanella sp.]|uniref:AraC family transcriptional regulator n=1 Tax=Shewanella sp. TaxID=50422 RepID=UPI0035665CB0
MQQEILEFRQSRTFKGAELSHGFLRQFDFGRHVHEDVHFGAVISGAQAFHHRGQRYCLSAGEVSTLSPDECHDGAAATENGYEVRVLSLPLEHLASAAAELGVKETGFIKPLRRDKLLYQHFLNLHGLLYQQQNPLMEQTALLDFCERLFGVSQASPNPISHSCHQVQLAKAMLADSPEPVTLDELGDATGLGRYKLLRRFRAATGISPHQWQLRLRLERAKKSLMLAHDMSLTDVAHAHGFCDLSHFSRHFRQAFLTSPKAYRQATWNHK